MIIITGRGMHFVNGTIQILMNNFMIKHRNTTTYHPQENRFVKSINKILHKGLTNIFNIDRDY